MIKRVTKTSLVNPVDSLARPSHDAQDTVHSRRVRIFLWIFSIAMVLTAGSAFIIKLCDFYITATTKGSQAMASFLIPVLNYLIVAMGFACLFLWAYFSGQFRDVEAPKYRMLEMQQQIDRDGG